MLHSDGVFWKALKNKGFVSAERQNTMVFFY